jgi:hypothetical protein
MTRKRPGCKTIDWPSQAEIHDELEGLAEHNPHMVDNDEACIDHLREAERAWQEPQE